MKHLTFALILGIFVFLTDAGQAAAVPQNSRHLVKEPQATSQNMIRDSTAVQAETARILLVLKQRIKDPKVLARTREKLLTLRAREIRLLSALCDRITSNKDATRSNVMFSLVTTLIVFS
jgi:hypothetical protein